MSARLTLAEQAAEVIRQVAEVEAVLADRDDDVAYLARAGLQHAKAVVADLRPWQHPTYDQALALIQQAHERLARG